MGQITNPPANSNQTLSLKSRVGGGGAMKDSIILFDSIPGTKTFLVPDGVFRIRRAVVGAGGSSAGNALPGFGGGYSEDFADVSPGQSIPYIVGARNPAASGPGQGGTSSCAGVIAATGGSNVAAGVGSGGRVNTRGGGALAGGTLRAGGASGHRFGDGGDGAFAGPSANTPAGAGGGGWGQSGNECLGGAGLVDGFGLGLIPAGSTMPKAFSSNQAGSQLLVIPESGGYGAGGSGGNAGDIFPGGNGGIGGGAGITNNGRIGFAGLGGGGAGAQSSGNLSAGNGCVIIEDVT